MAAPAVPAFGVTTALLEERFFGGRGISGVTRQAAMADDVITEVASTLEAKLAAHDREADQITEAWAPRSYRWCQTAIFYGAAAEYGRRSGMASADQTDGWDRTWRDRMRELDTDPGSALPDLVQAQGTTGVSYSFR